MKKSDVVLGMKVVPFKKTAKGYGRLSNSYSKNVLKNQRYLYVTGWNDEDRCWELARDKGDTVACDFFMSGDFKPYIPVRRKVK